MKILIMEDETQIREGITQGIKWVEYGISEVYTAQNGKSGFEMAQKYMPDIILTDIRMPRLDGIAAVKRLRKILPRCSIIFISAYPEKQYLKEAIRLKAVNFLEKPVDMQELKKVLKEAVIEQRHEKRLQEQEEKAYLYNAQQLVLLLNKNIPEDKAEYRQALKNVGIQTDDYYLFVTVLVRYMRGENPEDEKQWSVFCAQNEKRIFEAPVRILAAQKQMDLMVYHLFMTSEEQLSKTLKWIQGTLKKVKRCYILVGSVQRSYVKLCESYNDAVVQMNRAFYSPYGEIISGNESDIEMTLNLEAWMTEFTEKLWTGHISELPILLREYKEQILRNKKVHYTIIQEFYLYIYGELGRYAEQNDMIFGEKRFRYVKEFLKNENFYELSEGAEEFIAQMQSSDENDGGEVTVRIKKYINSNYCNPWISVREISEAMGKSVSHICVAFKKDTGKTINQYLTEVRMEAAKILLGNPSNSIKTVAEACGYTESSYFTRMFKKYVGCTPSEYRGEKNEIV